MWRFVGRFIEVMEMGGNGSGMRKVELLCEHLDEDFGNYWGGERQEEWGKCNMVCVWNRLRIFPGLILDFKRKYTPCKSLII